ncbi:unnamed protein product [Paramecium primaurelia]|uniref:Ubiquitin-like domain-containing protein n=1 Tax=Paramecium primaurelia TaxID=5886 RepID=A0A8S1KQG0_PARPR|nr:unnamed protein product [Paramecium primaurelia]
MPPKKKKSKKSKKSKKKEEYLPSIFNIPQYENPDIVTPKVDLIIKLVHPVTDLFTLKIRVPITTRVEQIHEEISKMHQGAISGIQVCRDRFSPEDVLDPKKTLEQCGIFDGEIKLLYDYKPIVGPLLK